MKNNKEFNKLGIADKMKAGEELGAKVAKIMNDARKKANKILAESGHGVNINIDFYKLDKEEEVANG
jgi:hypothetical protein